VRKGRKERRKERGPSKMEQRKEDYQEGRVSQKGKCQARKEGRQEGRKKERGRKTEGRKGERER
jgi:hypothetical protein